MTISMDFITGVAIGLEFVDAIPEDGIDNTVIVDILILRLMFQWP